MSKEPLHCEFDGISGRSSLDTASSTQPDCQGSNSGTRAVVIGGGTGAPVSIRALLSLGLDTSAVVAMADDGGSTGILREEADVTPPGDIRKCIAAFARDQSSPLVQAFRYRLSVARNHALGNLMLAALEDATGSFPEAISICERLLDVRGHVYPSTLDHVTLSARTRDGREIDGQAVACRSRTALERVTLHADRGFIAPYQPALDAIRNADLIVLGPGSLFTSVIVNLLVPGVLEAIRDSRGRVLFICSVADVQGETWGLTAREHVEALFDHGLEGLLDYVLIHTKAPLKSTSSPDRLVRNLEVSDEVARSRAASSFERGCEREVEITYEDMMAIRSMGPVVMLRNLSDPEHPSWHEPHALREALIGVLKLCHLRQK